MVSLHNLGPYKQKIMRYIAGTTALRADDVWLPSFPKSGSTWVRFLLCNIISLTELEGRPVDFHLLDSIMPALGYSDLSKPWPYTCIPRFIKTHKPYRAFLFARPKRTIYVIRDPRDAMVSYYHFQQAHKIRPFTRSISDFIRHIDYGLEAYIRHYLVWKPHITHIVQYESLKQDTKSELQKILQIVEAQVVDELTTIAVERSSFSRIRAAQERTGLSGRKRFQAQFRFARKGQIGQWADYFSKADMVYYKDLCDQYQFDYCSLGYSE
jgi:estrone sulfotransferase